MWLECVVAALAALLRPPVADSQHRFAVVQPLRCRPLHTPPDHSAHRSSAAHSRHSTAPTHRRRLHCTALVHPHSDSHDGVPRHRPVGGQVQGAQQHTTAAARWPLQPAPLSPQQIRLSDVASQTACAIAIADVPPTPLCRSRFSLCRCGCLQKRGSVSISGSTLADSKFTFNSKSKPIDITLNDIAFLLWMEVGRGMTEGGFVVKLGLKGSETTANSSGCGGRPRGEGRCSRMRSARSAYSAGL